MFEYSCDIRGRCFQNLESNPISGDPMPLVVDSTGNDLTYKLIGLAMEVHNELGHGFQEEVYEKAMEVKLNNAGL